MASEPGSALSGLMARIVKLASLLGRMIHLLFELQGIGGIEGHSPKGTERA